MSDAIFREMFVELPAALFEALKGIGEQAVREAQKPRTTTRATPSARADLLLRALQERHGWRSFLSHRSEQRRSFIVRFVRACVIVSVVEYPEQPLHLDARDAVDAAFDFFDRAELERPCTCIPRT
jgi:hypothetical protein